MLLKLKPSIYAPLVKLIAVGLDIIALVSIRSQSVGNENFRPRKPRPEQ